MSSSEHFERASPEAAAPAPTLVYREPVALIGGGEADPADIEAAIARAGATIAADGGANRFIPGAAPRLDAVIGDMDSVQDLDAWRAQPDCRVVALPEQDTTDLEKCLYSVAAPLFLGVGFFGARLDHTLAALNLLAKRPDQRILLIGREDVCFLTPLCWRASLWPGARVSIFPLPTARGVASEGLRWPIDGLEFAIGDGTGVSNEAIAGEVTAVFESRRAAIILDRSALDAAIASVTAG